MAGKRTVTSVLVAEVGDIGANFFEGFREAVTLVDGDGAVIDGVDEEEGRGVLVDMGDGGGGFGALLERVFGTGEEATGAAEADFAVRGSSSTASSERRSAASWPGPLRGRRAASLPSGIHQLRGQ